MGQTGRRTLQRGAGGGRLTIVPVAPAPDPAGPPEPPPDRGRLMDAATIARELFHGERTEKWVRQHVAPDDKLPLGHSTVRWWERDVLRWIESRKVRPRQPDETEEVEL